MHNLSEKEIENCVIRERNLKSTMFVIVLFFMKSGQILLHVHATQWFIQQGNGIQKPMIFEHILSRREKLLDNNRAIQAHKHRTIETFFSSTHAIKGYASRFLTTTLRWGYNRSENSKFSSTQILGLWITIWLPLSIDEGQ